jgi:nitric oxide reductase large subunit
MTGNETSRPESGNVDSHPTADGPLPEFVDWLLGVVIVLGGSLSLIGGSALMLVDRDALAEGIEEGTVTVTIFSADLTENEMLEVADAVVSWAGIGLLVTGIGTILFGAGYIVIRHRKRQRAGTDDPVPSYGTHAILGAVASGLLSFIPFSPGIGGALAGYLERGESTRTISVGALAGLLAMLPILLILLFVLIGLVTGLQTIDQSGIAILTGATLLFVLMLVATIGAGLGALGGYIGGWLAERPTSTT